MSRGAGAALHRKPGGLVQHHDVGVLVQDHVLQRLQRLRRRFRELACGLGRIELQRRNANALPFLQPVLAVGALAVDAQLAFADDALDVGERQAGKARLEKAVDAHVVLVRGHDDGLDLCRQRLLGGASPAPPRRPEPCSRRGSETRGGLLPGRAACGRSPCMQSPGFDPERRRSLGRSPDVRDFASGLLTRRLMAVFGSKGVPLRSANAANRHREIGTNRRCRSAMPGPNHRKSSGER